MLFRESFPVTQRNIIWASALAIYGLFDINLELILRYLNGWTSQKKNLRINVPWASEKKVNIVCSEHDFKTYVGLKCWTLQDDLQYNISALGNIDKGYMDYVLLALRKSFEKSSFSTFIRNLKVLPLLPCYLFLGIRPA